MTTTTTEKRAAAAAPALHDRDTGSAAVQITQLTTRITELTGHFTTHKKDHGSRRGLMKMVGQRRRLLRYLHRTDPARYDGLVSALNLRG